jgi:hypothetical protein
VRSQPEEKESQSEMSGRKWTGVDEVIVGSAADGGCILQFCITPVSHTRVFSHCRFSSQLAQYLPASEYRRA